MEKFYLSKGSLKMAGGGMHPPHPPLIPPLQAGTVIDPNKSRCALNREKISNTSAVCTAYKILSDDHQQCCTTTRNISLYELMKNYVICAITLQVHLRHVAYSLHHSPFTRGWFSLCSVSIGTAPGMMSPDNCICGYFSRD